MGDLDGFQLIGDDPGPDDMAVLPAFLAVKDDGARLGGKAQLLFNAPDVILVLRAGEGALARVGINGEAIEKLFAACDFGDGVPFLERAGKIAGDRSPDMNDFDALVVVRVEEVNCQLLAVGPLACLGHHEHI